MQLDGAALYENRLKCLYTETVKGRRAVEHDRMSLDHGFESIPDGSFASFHHLACALDVLCLAGLGQALHNKGLEQLECHFLRQTALVHLQLRADDDNWYRRQLSCNNDRCGDYLKGNRSV